MIKKSLESFDWKKVVDLVRKWVVELVEMNKGQQVGLVMTGLGVLGTA